MVISFMLLAARTIIGRLEGTKLSDNCNSKVKKTKCYDLIYYFNLPFLTRSTSKISWHGHFHHSNNKKWLVSSLSHLLNPISCQVLLNLPFKLCFWCIFTDTCLVIVFYHSFSTAVPASVLPWEVKVISANTIRQCQAYDKTHHLPPTEWSDTFFFPGDKYNFPSM